MPVVPWARLSFERDGRSEVGLGIVVVVVVGLGRLDVGRETGNLDTRGMPLMRFCPSSMMNTPPHGDRKRGTRCSPDVVSGVQFVEVWFVVYGQVCWADEEARRS